MTKVSKVYNVDIYDIVWCDEAYGPVEDIKTLIENYTAYVYLDLTEDERIQEILAQAEADISYELNKTVYIASAKVKINDYYFLANMIDGI